MSAATTIGILGIAIAAFFGLGGVDKTRQLIDGIKSNESVTKIFDNTKTTIIPNQSQPQIQQIITPQPTQQQETERINTIIIDSREPPSSQNTVNVIPDSTKLVTQTQTERKESEIQLTQEDPFLTRSTSLEGSLLSTGPQIKRGTSKFNQVKANEAQRAEEIFAKLFGNVGNPNF